jgi:hypothetical protein
MHVRHLKRLLALVLALCTQRAWAFLDPPYLTPANPIAGELVSVNIYGGECDIADDGVVWPPPVTQQGNAITILLTGIHEGDPEFCNFGIGTDTKPVGRFPPGNYTLDVERRYGTVFSEWTQETLGIIPFTVSAAPQQQPVETPMLSLAGLTALLLALVGAALRNLRVRLA